MEHKLNTDGIYISPMGVEVHQMYYYYYFLLFFLNGTFSLNKAIIEKEQPWKLNYSNLIKYGIVIGKGDYNVKKATFNAEIKNHTTIKGQIQDKDIILEIKSVDHFLFSATYKLLEKQVSLS